MTLHVFSTIRHIRAGGAVVARQSLIPAIIIALWLVVLPHGTGFYYGERSRLAMMNEIYSSTATEDFDGYSAAFDDAIAWHGERLHRSGSSGAHVACAEYGDGLQARLSLEDFLPPASTRLLSNHKEHGACFIVTASSTQATILGEHPPAYALSLFFPLPSVLKLAPGLLDHDPSNAGESGRLRTTYGNRVKVTNNVQGLSLSLSPGVLAADRVSKEDFRTTLRRSLMSSSVDLHAANFWSDPTMLSIHKTRPEGALRADEWTRAADVVHRLSFTEGRSPGEICSWHSLAFHHNSDDHFMLTGNERRQSPTYTECRTSSI